MGKMRVLGSVLIIALLAVGVLSACGKSEPESGASSAPEPGPVEQSADAPTSEGSPTVLAGTEWRLLYFESMDDAIGRAKPEPSQTYTMRLNADGTVNMALNCNRANGAWTIEPASDGVSGRFSFGPLASTKALCPPPSMDERVVADAQHVTGFLLRDGNLYLSLMADAGIYAWAPATGPRHKQQDRY